MKTSRRATRWLALGLAITLAACGEVISDGVIGPGPGSGSQPGGTGGGATVDCTTVANNEKIACLANALEAMLPAAEQSVLQLQYTADNAKRWSYLPCGTTCRNGIRLQDLAASQLSAALALSRTALEPRGYATFDAVRTAEYILSQQRAGYGGLLYNVAFVGAPSSASPWLMQLNGNDYAITLHVSGGVVTGITPYAVGIEPQSFSANGSSYAPMQSKKSAMYAMINSLDATQKASAQLAGVSFDDLLLGPGQDNVFPSTPQGIPVSSLSASQQALVKAAMAEWVNDAPAAVAAATLPVYQADSSLARTYISWATSTDSTVSGSYVRIDGPRVWIELLAHTGDVFTNQIRFRSIWRDQAMDYGELGP